jgi:hypothetical protein
MEHFCITLLIAKLQEEDWGLKFDHAWSLCLFYVINANIDNFEFYVC